MEANVGEEVYLHLFLIPTVDELLSFTPFHFIPVEERSPYDRTGK